MRFLQTTVDPACHGWFFLDNFRALARSGAFPRVLVSGAADHAMAAHVIAGYRLGGAEPAITVVDQCETPLLLNRWYAGRASADVQTTAASILDFRPRTLFDVICTHCFLGYFDPRTRPLVIRAWYDWLRPGGKVVTVTGIRRGFTGTMIRFSPEQADAYVERVVDRARRHVGALDVDVQTLAGWARTYTDRFWNYPTYSEDELREMFEVAGFTIDHIRTGLIDNGLVDGQRHKGGAGNGLQGPSVRGAIEYTSIVATR